MNDDTDRDIDEILADLTDHVHEEAMYAKKHGSTPYYWTKTAKAQLNQLIKEKEVEAAMKELASVQVRLMSVGVGENRLSKLNAERMSELQQQLKGKGQK